MLSTLRTRLLLSYAVLIVIVMASIAVGVTLAFLQNPRLLYPDSVVRLRIAAESLPPQLEKAWQSAPERTRRLLERAASMREIRVVLLDAGFQELMDTGGPDLPFSRMATNAQVRNLSPDQVRIVRSRLFDLWLYSVTRFEEGTVLILAMPAPRLRTILREQFVTTFVITGGLALLISVLLALAMGGWIAAPLRRMVAASQAVARGENPSVDIEGPVEVQELARSMNEMSQRVQLSQQSQRDFVANVSHELKTPLTSIQGFAQAILDGTVQTPDGLQQAAEVIFNEANRMHRLVLDLLSLARLEAGTADLQRAPVDLSALLQGVIDKFSLHARQAQVELSYAGAEELILIGDGDRLAQVFTNLVDNAIKFSPPGGWVTVSSAREESNAMIRVQDSGPGISAENQARVFERFFQVDKSRKGGAGRGIGLGLSIARQIILAHHGNITIESQPGQGSCFVVKIPLSRADDSTLITKSKFKR